MALKDAGRDQKIVLVGRHDPGHAFAQVDGAMDAVLTQPPLSVVMNSVRIFCNLRDKRDPLAGVEALRISVVFRENLPDRPPRRFPHPAPGQKPAETAACMKNRT